MLWNTKVTPKAQMLGWRVFLNKLPTKDNLLTRGIQLQNNLCELCCAHEENVDHLFFSCTVSQMVCNMYDRWLGLSTVHHVKARANFQQFHLFDLNSTQNLVWKGMWLAIIGEIWNHRNGVIFNHRKVDPIEIFDQAQAVAWAWMKYKIQNMKFSYSNWHFSPHTCLKFL